MNSSLKSLYRNEVAFELNKRTNSAVTEIVSEKDVEPLPEPVQRFFHHCGFVGKEKPMNAKIDWKEAFLKRSRHGKWMPLGCLQFNDAAEPARIVYMKSNLAGLFLFEGRDKFQNGHGNMLIKLLNFITLGDAKGPEMDASALVTVLAETFLVPGYALQPYLSWTAIDATSAGATLTYNGVTVSGTFQFNSLGEMLRFETDDRYLSAKGNSYQKQRWYVTAGNYKTKNGVCFATRLTAAWLLEEEPFEYFRGTIEDITYNVQLPQIFNSRPLTVVPSPA